LITVGRQSRTLSAIEGKLSVRCWKTLSNARSVWLIVAPFSVIKYTILVVIFLGLGGAFFLQKQHEKKAALELRQKREEAAVKAHLTPSPVNSSPKVLPKLKPTPVLGPVPTSKPKPTPMLPKPTPMLQQTP
jgi:hypothetical protein